MLFEAAAHFSGHLLGQFLNLLHLFEQLLGNAGKCVNLILLGLVGLPQDAQLFGILESIAVCVGENKKCSHPYHQEGDDQLAHKQGQPEAVSGFL